MAIKAERTVASSQFTMPTSPTTETELAAAEFGPHAQPTSIDSTSFQEEICQRGAYLEIYGYLEANLEPWC